ncbi:MAG: hypothetical protein GY930_15105 [bacterium]|nr:hypothetical protein [bacterium]
MVICKFSPNSLLRGASLLAIFAVVSAPAQAQSYDFTLDQNLSSASLVSTFGVDLDATLKGDYDATTNPGGTRTVPGLFGGSGNQDIPVDLGLAGDLDHMGAPTGSFTMDLDLPNLSMEVSALDLDFLGGNTASTDLTLDLLFSTFRTFSPDSLYLGGFPVGLPLGNQSVSDFRIVQTGSPVPGVLIPAAIPGHYGFSTLVSVSVTMTLDFQGTPTPVGPMNLVLSLAGALFTTGPNPSIDVDFNQAFQQTTLDPLPGFALTDMPFDAPTFLPAGSTAHLLISGLIDQIDVDATLMADLTAIGTPSCGFTNYCTAAVNSTGLAGVLDAIGSSDVLMQDLTLNSSNLPLNVIGFYLMSPARTSVSLPSPSEGLLCVGGPLYRLNGQILQSGATGTMSLAMDFNNLPQGQAFQAGSTWNFQLWHRDMNPNNTSNTTNAVEIKFCQ